MSRVRLGLVLIAVLIPAWSPLTGRPATAAPPPLAGDAGPGETPLVAARLVGEDGSLDRDALIAAVLERNPDLVATQRALEASRARADAAGRLADPMASYSLAPLSPFDDDVSFGHVIEVGQEVPWPGTLATRRQQAEARAATTASSLEELRQELALGASELFDEYLLLHRSLAINAEHQRLMEQFRQVATARYAAGVAPQQAPLAAEVEWAHLIHQEVVLDTERRTVVARLNALLHRPPTAALPPAPATIAPLPAPPTDEIPLLVERAVARRPELAAKRSEIEARIAASELARLAARPDLRPMASYNSMWNMEAHRWMVGLGLSLPVRRDRIRSEITEADAELEAARRELEALRDRVAAEVAAAAFRLQESRHVIRLFHDRLLPPARDQVAAARSGFSSGQVDFLAVIEAERNLRDVELGLAEAEAEGWRRLARLQRALGRIPGDDWSGDAETARSPATSTHHAAAAPAARREP